MEEKSMSAQEILQITADLIGDIVVPVKYADQIARPLCQAVANIEAVLAAFNKPKEGEEENGV